MNKYTMVGIIIGILILSTVGLTMYYDNAFIPFESRVSNQPPYNDHSTSNQKSNELPSFFGFRF